MYQYELFLTTLNTVHNIIKCNSNTISLYIFRSTQNILCGTIYISCKVRKCWLWIWTQRRRSQWPLTGSNPAGGMDFCLVGVVCCQVKVSAQGSSLAQRSP